jgi:hypothetical protein
MGRTQDKDNPKTFNPKIFLFPAWLVAWASAPVKWHQIATLVSMPTTIVSPSSSKPPSMGENCDEAVALGVPDDPLVLGVHDAGVARAAVQGNDERQRGARHIARWTNTATLRSTP